MKSKLRPRRVLAAPTSVQLQLVKPPRKHPRKPRQPITPPVEPNWDLEAFNGVVPSLITRLAAAQGGSSLPRCLPEHATATFATLILVHELGWVNHQLFEQWCEAHEPGSVAMFVHLKASVALTPGMAGHDAIKHHRLKASVDACWGQSSLVEAQLESLAEVLARCPQATHIALASGHDIPTRLVRPGLLPPCVSLYGAYEFMHTEMAAIKQAVVEELVGSGMAEHEAQSWGHSLIFHHQWAVLSREHAAALVLNSAEILRVAPIISKACRSVKSGMAPDEVILLTALRQRGFIRSMQRVNQVKPGVQFAPGTLTNCYPTFVVFPATSSPHPVLWTSMDGCVKCQDDTILGQEQQQHMSLASCLDVCTATGAFFCRKVAMRQTRGGAAERALLLNRLRKMWAGLRG